jgi:hypothetical protein
MGSISPLSIEFIPVEITADGLMDIFFSRWYEGLVCKAARESPLSSCRVIDD